MKKSNRLKKAIAHVAAFLTLSLGPLFEATAQTETFLFPVFPNSSQGNSYSTVPFTGTSGSVRFQQLYDFRGVTLSGYSGPFLIQVMYFREDEGRAAGFASIFPDLQINLSTTTRVADDLSSVFAENVGVDDTAVVPRGAFRFLGSDDGSFTAYIGLATNPFYYDPAQGNLLLDVRNFGGGRTLWSNPPFEGPAYVDAWDLVGDRVSSVSANSVDALSGTTSSLGLVTRLVITPVPEPSTVALLLVGIVACGFSARQYLDRKR